MPFIQLQLEVLRSALAPVAPELGKKSRHVASGGGGGGEKKKRPRRGLMGETIRCAGRRESLWGAANPAHQLVDGCAALRPAPPCVVVVEEAASGAPTCSGI